MRKLVRFARHSVNVAKGVDLFVIPEVKVDHVVLGTVYGGWPVIPEFTSKDSVVYSFGVGEDASFDLELIRRFQCKVHAFDPTPKSMQWVAAQAMPPEFLFSPIGIGAENGELLLYPPADPNHVSYTVKKNDQSKGVPTRAQVCDLPTIMERLGHRDIDILKMDVEGTEYDVIKKFAQQPMRPSQLMIEFHHGMYGYRSAETKTALAELKRIGYQIYYVSPGRHEFAFVRFPTAAPSVLSRAA
ncbi:FkbM family methyltransferase [Cupriavidus basilensis]|uniref:FkbM family methyltransferase n=1 Tax=Cupriavidus basilensis TaxID=68895 RepID=A0A643G4N0_9BURK|nr:FkbM family methyltransferase [Cupriavidus basilensis]QOT75043.1 FkbM family methyltransferase [Cupriavidus basilensis]